MKLKPFVKKIFISALVSAVLSACAVTVFAVGEDEPYAEYTEPAVTEYQEPQTEQAYTQSVYTEPVYTEALTEPQTEYEQPQTEAPATEYVEQQTEAQQTQQAQQVETQAQQSTTEFQAPTVAKTVSDKKYTTNYAAGIASWACVGVGAAVVVVVMISTKVGARKERRIK